MMVRWVVALLAAAAAWAAEPSAELLSSDLFLLPPGPLDLPYVGKIPTGLRAHTVLWGDEVVGAAVQSGGAWLAIRSRANWLYNPRLDKDPMDWLPAQVDWVAALGGADKRAEAEAVTVRAARRLWPDFAGPVDVSLHSVLDAGTPLSEAVFDVSAEPEPGVEVLATARLWTWGRRVSALDRRCPIVPKGWQPAINREQAVARARQALALPVHGKRGQHAYTTLTSEGDAPLERAPRWEVLLSDAPTRREAMEQKAGTALAQVDAASGEVLRTLSTDGFDEALEALSDMLEYEGLPEEETGDREHPMVVGWHEDGPLMASDAPAQGRPWWGHRLLASCFLRHQGQWVWHQPSLLASFSCTTAAVVAGWLVTNPGQELLATRLVDGETRSAPDVIGFAAAGKHYLATVTSIDQTGTHSVELRLVTSPATVLRRLAQHENFPFRLAGDSSGRWLAYCIEERLCIADLAMQQPMRHVAFAAGSRCEAVAWLPRHGATLCVVSESSVGHHCLWLVDPISGARSELRAPKPLSDRDDWRVVAAASPGSLVVDTNAARLLWDVAEARLRPLDLPDLSAARPLTFRPGHDTIDLALGRLEDSYQAIRRRRPVGEDRRP